MPEDVISISYMYFSEDRLIQILVISEDTSLKDNNYLSFPYRISKNYYLGPSTMQQNTHDYSVERHCYEAQIFGYTGISLCIVLWILVFFL